MTLGIPPNQCLGSHFTKAFSSSPSSFHFFSATMIFTAIRDILHIMLWVSYPLCIVGDAGGSAVAFAHDRNVEAARARNKAITQHYCSWWFCCSDATCCCQ
jgi:hypothetical protein